VNKTAVFVVAIACAAFALSAVAQDHPAPLRHAPSPSLQIDQHRQSVVEGIVATQRDALVQRCGAAAAERKTRLRVTLMGPRAARCWRPTRCAPSTAATRPRSSIRAARR
jgi:hypothetical protein